MRIYCDSLIQPRNMPSQCHWQLAMRWNQKANGSIIDTLFPWRRSSVIVLKSWLLCLVVRWMNFVLFSKPTWLSVSHDHSNTFLQLWKLIEENCDTLLGRRHLFEHFLCRKIWWFNFANGADQILVCASIRHAKQWNHSTQFTQHKSTSIINFQIQSFHFLSLSQCAVHSFVYWILVIWTQCHWAFYHYCHHFQLSLHTIVVDETRTFFFN